MNHPIAFDVFGRSVLVERIGGAWRVAYPGPDGTRRPADDIRLAPELGLAKLPGALADLCHEWATPAHGDVRAALDPVFVYGTLREGYPNARHLEGARVGERWQTVEAYPLMLCGPRGSPCLFDEAGAGHPVTGELYRVSLAALEGLDALERIHEPDGYRRRRALVRPVAGGEARSASIYLKARRHAPAPHDGPHREFTAEQASRYRPRAAG